MTSRASNPSPDLSQLRIEYQRHALAEQDVDPNPIAQFTKWLSEAIAAGATEPNAMTLATSTPAGMPSARIVLLKVVDGRGFAFFTNYLSRKGRELEENPRAALVFYWPELERQVRVEGDIVRTSEEESAHYFSSRPPEARIGSAASPQSQPIASREVLEEWQQALRQRYPRGDVPCPSHWGGYRVLPRRIEFWQGRASRLHDRIEYVFDETTGWVRRRLAP